MAKIYSIDGKEKGQMNMPNVFSTVYRPDLIQAAVVMLQANSRQSMATDPAAGLRTSGDYFGSRRNTYRQTINRALTHLPRVKSGGGGLGRVVRVPQAKGGRRSHPPSHKIYAKKMNRRVYQLALNSAIAATADENLVKARGHKIASLQVPIIVDEKIDEIQKTKDLIKFIISIGLKDEIDSTKKKKILFVTALDKGLRSAASNIDGVEFATINDLDVEQLAPGTKAGRLTIWSESALKELQI